MNDGVRGLASYLERPRFDLSIVHEDANILAVDTKPQHWGGAIRRRSDTRAGDVLERTNPVAVETGRA
jgi:hypothetical protein